MKRKFVLWIVGAVFVGLIGCCIYGYVLNLHAVTTAYAFWNTGEAIVRYLDENDNKWPDNKEALRDYYKPGFATFDENDDYVRIDYSVDACETIGKIRSGELKLEGFNPVTFVGKEFMYESRHANANANIFDDLSHRECKETMSE